MAVKISPVLFQLFFNHDISLKKSDGNVNILLLGTAGGNHEGPDLTDTIIFTSLNPQRNKITLISIPRDLWIADLKQKINYAYAYGENKQKGGGLILTKAIMSKILSQPVDYGIRIDFDGFIKAVDLAGGFDIKIEKAFDDYQYPIAGKEDDPCGHKDEELALLATASSQLEAFPCRYIHIHFDEGLQHMDGQKALQFVRSRHANGDEGSDFARNKRQELILKAFKDKIFSVGTLLNPAKVLNFYDILQKSIDTDIKQDEMDDFIRLAQKMKTAEIKSSVLDFGDSEKGRPGLLLNPPIGRDYDNLWVLIPKAGRDNFSEIQKYVKCEIEVGACP